MEMTVPSASRLAEGADVGGTETAASVVVGWALVVGARVVAGGSVVGTESVEVVEVGASLAMSVMVGSAVPPHEARPRTIPATSAKCCSRLNFFGGRTVADAGVRVDRDAIFESPAKVIWAVAGPSAPGKVNESCSAVEQNLGGLLPGPSLGSTDDPVHHPCHVAVT